MKKVILSLSTLVIASSILFTSCKTKEVTPTSEVSASETSVSTTFANDNNNVESNVDDAMNDISAQLSGSARLDAETTCTVSSVTVAGTKLQRKITYDGSVCDRTKSSRSGTIIITLQSGTDFKDRGATYTVEYQTYAVTINNKTLTMTGTHTVTNITGGLPRFVLSNPKEFPLVEHSIISSDMTITFDTTKTARVWNVARKVSYGNIDGSLGLTISGLGSADGYSNLVTWGVNRFGNKFYNQINTPIVSSSKCGFRFPIAGERKHTLELSDGKIENTANVSLGSDGCGNGIKLKIKNKNGKEKNVTIDLK